MKQFLDKLDPLNRRDFASRLAKAFLGVGLLPAALPGALTAASPPVPGGRAKSVIYLFMNGGMSHLDTFDPKPGTEAQGPVEPIATSADGIQVSEHFPLTASQMKRIAVVRSLQSNQGAHDRGQYFMRTGYTKRGTIQHPAMGAWSLQLSGSANPTLPANVRIGRDSRHPGAGFMESRLAPLPIGDPTAGLQNSQLAKGVSEPRLNGRLKLASDLDAHFRNRYDLKNVRAYTDAYDDAIKLMNSRDLAVFDVSRESQDTRGEYGENAFGQGCLLARRLVESNVRFVEVSLGGWDTHQDNFNRMETQAAILDRALATLINDLARRGLLDTTLVVLATEFGRTPTINQNTGRDHYPKAFTGLFAGGGIRGGQVYGQTDEDGSEVIENAVTIPDFNATIAHAMNLPQDEVITSPSGRPFTVANKGKPITALF